MEGLGRLQLIRAFQLAFEENCHSKTACVLGEAKLNWWLLTNKAKLRIRNLLAHRACNVRKADLNETLDVLVEGARDSTKNCLLVRGEVDSDSIAA
jgi:hypothetical protein